MAKGSLRSKKARSSQYQTNDFNQINNLSYKNKTFLEKYKVNMGKQIKDAEKACQTSK